ncbi:MAG: hypothetical protein PHS95_00390 [Candidatus Pacebacteria bacterium]|nr:hypothetical protein [Candidatus Paceibacterota bacterium]
MNSNGDPNDDMDTPKVPENRINKKEMPKRDDPKDVQGGPSCYNGCGI